MPVIYIYFYMCIYIYIAAASLYIYIYIYINYALHLGPLRELLYSYCALRCCPYTYQVCVRHVYMSQALVAQMATLNNLPSVYTFVLFTALYHIQTSTGVSSI